MATLPIKKMRSLGFLSFISAIYSTLSQGKANPGGLEMEKRVFEKYDGGQVTETMLEEASKLFSEHYGVWSEHAAKMVGEFAKAGMLAHDRIGCVLTNTR